MTAAGHGILYYTKMIYMYIQHALYIIYSTTLLLFTLFFTTFLLPTTLMPTPNSLILYYLLPLLLMGHNKLYCNILYIFIYSKSTLTIIPTSITAAGLCTKTWVASTIQYRHHILYYTGYTVHYLLPTTLLPTVLLNTTHSPP